MLPPSSQVSFWQMLSPSPVPPKRRRIDESPFSNGWNSRLRRLRRDAHPGVHHVDEQVPRLAGG